METKKYYIAYMDILGYSDYIEKHPEKVNEFLSIITTAIEKIKKNVESLTHIGKDGFKVDINIKCKTFSDNVLLCLEKGDGENEMSRLIPFLISVASIQRGLVIEHGLLMRGGITIGDLFINDDFVFGKGLINVVNLEKQAENPCIIVSDELMNYTKSVVGVDNEGYEIIKRYVKAKTSNKPTIIEDEEYYNVNGEKYFKGLFYYQALRALIVYYEKEKPFINYLFNMSGLNLFGLEFNNFLVKEQRQNSNKFKDFMVVVDDVPFILHSHRDIVASKIKDFCNYDDVDKTDIKQVNLREKVIRKYIWMLRFHNSICESLGLKKLLLPHQYGCDMNNLRLIVKSDI